MNKSTKTAAVIAGIAVAGAVAAGFWVAGNAVLERVRKSACEAVPNCGGNYPREMPRFNKITVTTRDGFPLTRN